MKTTIHNFASVGDYLRFLRDTPQVHKRLHETSNTRGPVSWNGNTNDLDHAVSLVETGWAEGAAKVAHWRDKLSCFLDAAKTAKSRKFTWEVAGDFVDVGRYLTGEPECFGAEEETGEQVSGKVVTIRINACVSGALQPEAIIARGVSVLVAVDLLESLGRRCEVIVSQATSTPGNYGRNEGSTPNLNVDCNVVVKSASQPLDIDRLAYAVAHPGWFRRLGFKFMELCGHSPSGCRVSDLTDKGARPGVVEVDSLLTHVSLNQRSLRDHVLEVVQACGLEFDDEQLALIAAG